MSAPTLGDSMGAAGMTELETAFALLKTAARGDLAAQRALAESACGLLQTRSDLDPIAILGEGLVFARMAATQGDNGDDGRVISMLALLGHFLTEQGDEESSDVLQAEAIARVSLLAEQGVEIADDAVNLLVECATPDTVAMAKEYERALRI